MSTPQIMAHIQPTNGIISCKMPMIMSVESFSSTPRAPPSDHTQIHTHNPLASSVLRYIEQALSRDVPAIITPTPKKKQFKIPRPNFTVLSLSSSCGVYSRKKTHTNRDKKSLLFSHSISRKPFPFHTRLLLEKKTPLPPLNSRSKNTTTLKPLLIHKQPLKKDEQTHL